jgi:hypothetical protein
VVAQIEAGKQPAFTGNELDVRDFPVVVTDQFDPAALGEQVQNALFGAGDIHFVRSGKGSCEQTKTCADVIGTQAVWCFCGAMPGVFGAGRPFTGTRTVRT